MLLLLFFEMWRVIQFYYLLFPRSDWLKNKGLLIKQLIILPDMFTLLLHKLSLSRSITMFNKIKWGEWITLELFKIHYNRKVCPIINQHVLHAVWYLHVYVWTFEQTLMVTYTCCLVHMLKNYGLCTKDTFYRGGNLLN